MSPYTFVDCFSFHGDVVVLVGRLLSWEACAASPSDIS
jgi:hypothetical protein